MAKKKTTKTDPGRISKIKAFSKLAAKRWGNSISVGSKIPIMNIDRLSTGNFGLDIATFGGLPPGITMFWGTPRSTKTGSCLNAAAEWQKRCAFCYKITCKCPDREPAGVLWVDAEGKTSDSIMMPWMKAHGICLDSLLIERPDSGNEIVDVVDAAIRAGIKFVVVDSIANMTVKDEIIKAAEDGITPGRGAILCNSAVRKWVTAQVQWGFSDDIPARVLLINQIRMTFNQYCFHGDTPVMFADGSQVSIRDVVDQKLEGPILSWDGSGIVERRIKAWHDNGPLEEGEKWLTFAVDGTGGRRGSIGFTCTPNHMIITADGDEVRADSLVEGDELLSWYESVLDETRRSVVVGSLLGDGHLGKPNGRGKLSNLKLANSEQPDYLDWKLKILSVLDFKRVESCDRVSYGSKNSYELGLLRTKFYEPGCGYRKVRWDVVRSASNLAMAVWYADDGHYWKDKHCASISVKRLTCEEGHIAAAALSSRYPTLPAITYKDNSKNLYIPVKTFERFSLDIAPYTPSCMAYKLLPRHRDLVNGDALLSLPNPKPTRVPVAAPITKIHISDRKMRSKTRYDLSIEDDTFFMVGGDSRGVVVHNSPETLPGGTAQKYATRLMVRFHATKSRRRYRVAKDDGSFTDLKKAPDADAIPSYQETDYRVTDSSQCPGGRYGSYNYWMTDAHGRRKGDPDNAAQMVVYMRRYKFFQKVKGGTAIKIPEDWIQDVPEAEEFCKGRTQEEVINLFRKDESTQALIWKVFIRELTKG